MRLNDCGNQAKEPYLSLPLLAEQAATSLLLLSEVLIEHCLHIRSPNIRHAELLLPRPLGNLQGGLAAVID